MRLIIVYGMHNIEINSHIRVFSFVLLNLTVARLH